MYEYRVAVVKVVDGDTVDVLVDLGFRVQTKQRIRLARIDAPERGEPGYHEAMNALSLRLMNIPVTMRTTKPSKYGYFLGEFFVDGKNINDEMLEMGHAKGYAK